MEAFFVIVMAVIMLSVGVGALVLLRRLPALPIDLPPDAPEETT